MPNKRWYFDEKGMATIRFHKPPKKYRTMDDDMNANPEATQAASLLLRAIEKLDELPLTKIYSRLLVEYLAMRGLATRSGPDANPTFDLDYHQLLLGLIKRSQQ